MVNDVKGHKEPNILIFQIQELSLHIKHSWAGVRAVEKPAPWSYDRVLDIATDSSPFRG